MSFSQYGERAVLDQLFGCVVGQVNQTITAPAASTTSITVRGSSGSGSMDITATSGQVFMLMTPGTGATQNQYTNVDVVTATTGSTGTSLAIASQTIGKPRAVGDWIILLGSTSGFSPVILNNTWYVGVSTAVYTASAATILAGEPTNTGGYARVAQVNNAANYPASTGSAPATKAAGTVTTFPTSTAAYSTGATALQTYFIADSPTLGAGNIILSAALTTAQVVNNANIALAFPVGQPSITAQ